MMQVSASKHLRALHIHLCICAYVAQLMWTRTDETLKLSSMSRNMLLF